MKWFWNYIDKSIIEAAAVYAKHPRLAAIYGFVVIWLFTMGVYLMGQQTGWNRAQRTRNGPYTEQLQRLDRFRESLQELATFVDDEKKHLQEVDEVVAKLKAEKEKLEPVVQSDRETVEAILDVHSQRTQANVWWERAVGFILGVVSSLVASGLLFLADRAKKRARRSEP